jgi:co-chaperonin GroES (HSP10)
MGFETLTNLKLRPLRDTILVRDLDSEGIQLKSGIYIPSQDGKTAGIKPRWAKVYATGPDQNNVKEGEWVYVEHGRWTRGVEIAEGGETFTVRRVDPDNILLSADERPEDTLIKND